MSQSALPQRLKSGISYTFAPTNSRERRLMHLAFRGIEGVEMASNGEGRDRFLAVHPAGKTDLPAELDH
jgi:spoIIIJ-associated protein